MSTEESSGSTEISSGRDGQKPKVALIAGPTASGKSDLAVRLAQCAALAPAGAVVINADSAQVYADLAVLSARPTAAEMRNVPHRLFGSWDGAQACSAADWAAAARAEIDAAHHAGRLPILVGGTGLYIRTLLDGIAPIPPIDPQVRAEVRAMPVAEAWAALAREDPPRAAALAPADTTRVARALEVVRSTGAPLAAWHGRREGGIADRIALAAVVLMPDRGWLHARHHVFTGGAFAPSAVRVGETARHMLCVCRADKRYRPGLFWWFSLADGLTALTFYASFQGQ
eukprot:gene15195-15338_t